MNRETRNHLVWLSLLWVIFSAITEWLIQWAIDGWPVIASTQGVVTNEAIFFMMRATAPIFVLLSLIVIYSAIRFRVKQDDFQPAEAQYDRSTVFVGGWLFFSVVLNVLFIIYPGIYGLESLWSQARAATAKNPLVVNVDAQQWEWDFTYADQKISTVNKLVVPVGRPIEFRLASEDVMHSFWVPAWGIKKDVIPGETRTLFITPTKELTTKEDPQMRVQCSQICGVGHALMRAEVEVVSAQKFAQWVAKQQAPADAAAAPAAASTNSTGGAGASGTSGN